MRCHLSLVDIGIVTGRGKIGYDAVEGANGGWLDCCGSEGAGEHCHGGVVMGLHHTDPKCELHPNVPLDKCLWEARQVVRQRGRERGRRRGLSVCV